MSVDSFTASMFLKAVSTGGPAAIDAVADMYKQVTSNDEGPTKEQAAAVNAMMNMRCKINYGSYTGTVIGLNSSTGGFYPGGRYPVIVKIDKTQDGATNQVFEYGLDEVILLEA